MDPVRVLVADGLALSADSLAIALALYPEFYVLDERPVNGPAAIETATRLKPDVALVDFWLPDMDGALVAAALRVQVPGCKVILLSWLSAASHIDRALDAGIAAFVPKDCIVAQVAEVIRRVHSGEGPLYAETLKKVIEKRQSALARGYQRFASLTQRETQVLVLLNQGMTIKQIARRLEISPKTVTNHITQILSKTGTTSQNEVLARARESGFF